MNALTPEEFASIRCHPILRTRAEFQAILDTVCAEFGVDPAAISAATRGDATVCAARSMVCRIASQRGFNNGVIGRMINRDHTSVMHALRSRGDK